MPKRGEIEVLTSRRTAGAVADWLRDIYRPSEVTVLGCWGGRPDIQHLGTILERAAKRRREALVFTINIDRSLGESMFAIVDGAVIARGLHISPRPFASGRALLRFRENLRVALNGRVGRPKLTFSRMEKRVKRLIVGDERHRKRTAMKLRYERAWVEWTDRIHARGETLLTSSEPPPKI